MIRKSRNLSKDRIVQMAITILESEGLENLSMRKLADKLNVKAASLYNHIKNKTWLVKELQVFFQNPKNRLYNINFQATTWQELITSKIEASYKEFMARPYTLEIFSKYSDSTEEGVIYFEQYLSKMVDFGFSLSDAAYISNLIGIYVVGHCTFVLGVKNQKQEAPESIFAKTDPKITPLLDKFGSLGWFDLDKCYAFAVVHIIEGVASLQSINQGYKNV